MSDSAQWVWMMEYCKKQGIPPAQGWAWKKASDEYKEFLEKYNADKNETEQTL